MKNGITFTRALGSSGRARYTLKDPAIMVFLPNDFPPTSYPINAFDEELYREYDPLTLVIDICTSSGDKNDSRAHIYLIYVLTDTYTQNRRKLLLRSIHVCSFHVWAYMFTWLW